jgi:hypothetical protein
MCNAAELATMTDSRLFATAFPACVAVGLGGGVGGGSLGDVGELTVVEFCLAPKADASCSVSCLARKGRRLADLSFSDDDVTDATSVFRPFPLLLVLLRDNGA